MVCLGNICRSPLAEGVLQQKALNAGLQWNVDSAGTNSHVNEPPHPLSQKVAKLHGIDISRQRARYFVAADFDRFDKIYALSVDVLEEIRWISKNKFDKRKVDLLMNEVYPGSDLDVPDPYYGEGDGFERVLDHVQAACAGLLAQIRAGELR